MSQGERDAESLRLRQADTGEKPWRRWGPYLSERQWGTVREDYSANGDAWAYLPHEAARSHAYRWGEDGLGGFCDDQQILCLGVALWNGQDSILKERLFGLNNSEGNHGEDVKEIYYYLDAVPTYGYARMLYKYPQATYPYEWLRAENHRRDRDQPEFELLDTGLFDEDKYFDVDIEYAKADVDDILMRITVANRGPDAAQITLLPQVWFRNTWNWSENAHKPSLTAVDKCTISVEHETLGSFTVHYEMPQNLLFCDNETNAPKLFGATDIHGYFKDAFHEYLVNGNAGAVNPGRTGTKAAGVFAPLIPAGGNAVIRVRLGPGRPNAKAFDDFDAVLQERSREADAFYTAFQSDIPDEDARRVQRQAFAGMLWSKQYYYYDVREWLDGDPGQPAPPESRKTGRNDEWFHFYAADVIAMPDKWEYPWFAAWDWAFHLVTLALIDPRFAKDQLILLCQVWYMHPNGQMPAYEWKFGDVNPPVHAWAAMRIYEIDKRRNGGIGDPDFLRRVFIKLLLNFTWWVNRKDPSGRNVFQGGFLGLDNIGIFDRSAPLPVEGSLTQSDGTSWMAMYCLNMLRIALELAQKDHVYEDIAIKFGEHFLLIGGAMTNLGGEGLGLWDDEDNFYYDWLILSSGKRMPLRLRSIVGLIPLFAVEVFDEDLLKGAPEFAKRMKWYLQHRPKIAELVSRLDNSGAENRRLVAIARAFRMKRVIERMLDESEFLAPYGVRAISRYHLDQPYVFERGIFRSEVKYLPAESDSSMFGGNSNWRGPIWMPINYLLIECLRKYGSFYGDGFRVECPKGSGNMLSLDEVADELRNRLTRIFLRDANGRRPVFNTYEKLQTDPHFKDYMLFHEYFDGDDGHGLGASHQTGWTGLIANLIDELYAPDR